jgi:hypothetical protein
MLKIGKHGSTEILFSLCKFSLILKLFQNINHLKVKGKISSFSGNKNEKDWLPIGINKTY